MNECERLHDDLKAFLDGQLSPAARIAMRMHLNRCEFCRRELEEMRTLGTRMRAADSMELSDALRDRILASIPNTAPDAKVPMLPKWREKPVLIWGASASAVLGWFLLYPAINTFQEQSTRTASVNKQIGLGAHAYQQDYDDASNLRTSVKEAQITEGRDYTTYTHSRTSDKGSPFFPHVNGLQPLVGNGNGVPANSPESGKKVLSQLQVMQGDGVMEDAYKDASVPPGRVDGSIATGSGRAQSQKPLARVRGSDNIFGQGKVVEYDAPARVKAIQLASGTLTPQSETLRSYYATPPAAGEDLPTERQVHREASLTVEVPNAEQQSEAVERLVKESRGYVAQNELTTQEDHTRQASLTCKVPVDQFDTVMGQIARLGLLKGKTLSGEDITEKISDEQETGHVLRADIATTQEKLKTRRRHSETVRDEETLRQLRIRVAQSQARLKMLTRLGTLAEITVELDEKPKNAAPPEVKPSSPFMQDVSSTGQAAAHSFLMALRLPVQLLVWIVVYSPLWALIIFAYRRMTR